MAGIETIETYTAKEILSHASERKEMRPCTIESGVGDLAKGTVIGIIPTTEKFSDYDKSEVASAGAITADGGNTGNATFTAAFVQDNYTVTETVTITFTSATAFTVVGSVTGAMGTGDLAAEFKYPDSALYKVKFTGTAGITPMDIGDFFTVALVRAEAPVACGILGKDADAASADVQSMQYVVGNFAVSQLVGLDDEAVIMMSGKYDNYITKTELIL